MLREATRISPTFAEAYVRLGCILDALGNGDEAAAAFRELNRLKPGLANGARPTSRRQDEPSAVAEKTTAARKTIAVPSDQLNFSAGLAFASPLQVDLEQSIAECRLAIGADGNAGSAQLKLGRA